jgi:glutamine---fructose-6-phosphate transaminase (isomerizing)
MCGIVAGISHRPIGNILINGLKRLEYRGYDSAGITQIDNQRLTSHKVCGKVTKLELEAKLSDSPIGIAHTRWATHGAPSIKNAHPHLSNNNVAIVHNGIIENYASLKQELIDAGYAFISETDSEVIVHLIHQHYQGDLLKAVFNACQRLEGAYAIACLHTQHPEQLVAARQGSPLVIAKAEKENFIASDPLALLPVSQQFIYLQEGDFATITAQNIQTYNHLLEPVQATLRKLNLSNETADKGDYRHYMLKEIYEQPAVAKRCLQHLITNNHIPLSTFGAHAATLLPQIKRIHIVACGTSYHAALTAQYWLESIARISTKVEIASENRYRKSVVEDSTLLIALSQSGETADTLAALRQAKQIGYQATMAICNVPESSLMREADLSLLTQAEQEIGVAATKTFTAQLIALLAFTLSLANQDAAHLTKQQLAALQQLPQDIEQLLQLDDAMANLAIQFADKQHALFLARGVHYPIAMEGALKLKEISYCHAESYAAGELKHGPLALIDENMPVVVVAPCNELIDKVVSNIKEVEARAGQLYVFTSANAPLESNANITIIKVPSVNPLTSPILYNIPLQLLAYHVAVIKGTDVDQPRNLAKSVTVE